MPIVDVEWVGTDVDRAPSVHAVTDALAQVPGRRPGRVGVRWRHPSKAMRWFVVALFAALAFAARGGEVGGDWHEVRDGAVVLFRHGNAPGMGDPPGMRLDDCRTQRNLDEAGRIESRRIGEAFRERAIEVRSILTSRWCRARDTANEAFPGRAKDEPAFDSFFADRGDEPQRTAAARRVIDAWRGPGVLVVVTHQVNITALTGEVTRQGEGIVMRRRGATMVAVGSVVP